MQAAIVVGKTRLDICSAASLLSWQGLEGCAREAVMPGHLTPHAEFLLAVVAGSADVFATWRNPAIHDMEVVSRREQGLPLQMSEQCLSKADRRSLVRWQTVMACWCMRTVSAFTMLTQCAGVADTTCMHHVFWPIEKLISKFKFGSE